ncbi:hypothetical protein BDFG_07689 [Blastomyces dermatitidis ATCC 26199]|nr:hypothetical protein BDFG_07689 [Blastomyces dermatitidis ATCC 26199]
MRIYILERKRHETKRNYNQIRGHTPPFEDLITSLVILASFYLKCCDDLHHPYMQAVFPKQSNVCNAKMLSRSLSRCRFVGPFRWTIIGKTLLMPNSLLVICQNK